MIIERIIREDLGSDWTFADFAWRFRGGLVSNAYGNPWFERRTPHGFSWTSLGWQADAFVDIYADPVGDAITEVGTDCRTDEERANDVLRARTW